MKKGLLAFLVLGIIGFVFFINCEQEVPVKQNFAKPLVAVPVAPSSDPSRVVVLDSFTDGTFNYYFIDGGYVRNSFIAVIQEVHYNGITPMNSSATTVTEETITDSMTELFSNTYQNTTTTSAKASISIGNSWIGAKASVAKTQTNMSIQNRSLETSWTSVQNYASTSTISFTVGNSNEPAGWYRYSMYAIADLYFIVKTTRDNEHLVE